MLNRVIQVGRLTADPQLRYSQTGKAVTTFTIAVDRAFKKEGQPEADFPRIVQFGKGAEATANFMGKGSLVGVDGRLQTRTWDDSNGNKQYATEVIADSVKFLESKKKDNQQQQKSFESEGEPLNVSSSDLPF